MRLPRLMIAGSGSGCGKTTVTCGMLRILRRKGLRPSSYKCGPDYIDPLYHREVLGINSRNLDSFFSSESQLREKLRRGARDCDIAVIEGVMGYYDGLGAKTHTSCAEIADLTRTPVLLILDAAGRSSSVLAELQGFLNYREEGKWIAGIIFNRLSPMLYEDLASEASAMGVKPCGYLKRDDSHRFESRHLGLTLPEERADFQEEVDALADRLAQTVDIEAILELAQTAENIEEQTGRTEDPAVTGEARRAAGLFHSAKNSQTENSSIENRGTEYRSSVNRLRIALARDAAFCFYYIENIEYLESLGCRIIPFSPLSDSRLPDCDGLILPGGYPELYAKQLSENRPMLASVKKAILAGLPTIAECGGCLYLHEELTDAEGNSYAMAGVIPAGCHFEGLQRQFGYVTMTTLRDGVFGKAGTSCRGHEFHYYVSDAQRQDVLCEKPDGRRSWRGGMADASLYAGFTHLWLPSGPEAACGFVNACRKRRNLWND